MLTREDVKGWKCCGSGQCGVEGAVGASVFFGQCNADCDVLVQLPGSSALVISAEVFNREMEQHGAFFNLLIRHNQALMSQIMQTTVCNSLHSAEARCCRWLLRTHDHAGVDEFELTHEFLSTMLGVRRPTVTIAAAHLQQVGLIQYARRHVRIVDRERLELASCECYQAITIQTKRLLPELEMSFQLTDLFHVDDASRPFGASSDLGGDHTAPPPVMSAHANRMNP